MKKLWKDERGIAMTEGVIVLPFFILLWLALIFALKMWSGRLEAQVSSQREGLKSSIDGCLGNAKDLTAGVDVGINSDNASWLQRLGGDLPFIWSHADVRFGRNVNGLPEAFGKTSKKVVGRQLLLCNMEPKDGILDMLGDLTCEVMKGKVNLPWC